MVDYHQFREYLNSRRLQGVSIDSYLRDVAQFCDYLNKSGTADIRQVTRREISQYCDYMTQKGLAPVSMQRKLASIKRLYVFLCEEGQSRPNPVAGIHVCRREAAKAKALTDDQLLSLLSMPDTRSVNGIRDKAMFTLIYSTGMKVSELITLRIGDLQLSKKKLSIRRDELTLALDLDDSVCHCLGAYMASREMLCPKDDKTLFLNIYGSSITRQGVWKTLKKYAESAGLKGITLETLRRSFALRYLGAGHDIRSLCDILGHSDVSITRAYVKS